MRKARKASKAILTAVAAAAVLASTPFVSFASSASSAKNEADGSASYERFKARVAAIEDARGLPHEDVDAAVTKPAPKGRGEAPGAEPDGAAAPLAAAGSGAAAGRAPAEASETVDVEEGGRRMRVRAPVPRPVSEGEAPKIERIVDLGVSKLRAVGTAEGDVMLVADMGRYVIKGQILDVWQKKVLRTIDDIAASVGRVDLEGLGYDRNAYAGYRIGSGPKRVVAFIDPRCSWCHRMLEEIASDKTLLRDYQFVFHVIPMLGEESSRLAKALWCADAESEEKLRALRSGAKAIDALPKLSACRMDEQDHTVLLSGLLGIKAVPYVIAPDGRTSEGKPADMRMFLENNAAAAAEKAEKEENAAKAAKETIAAKPAAGADAAVAAVAPDLEQPTLQPDALGKGEG